MKRPRVEVEVSPEVAQLLGDGGAGRFLEAIHEYQRSALWFTRLRWASYGCLGLAFVAMGAAQFWLWGAFMAAAFGCQQGAGRVLRTLNELLDVMVDAMPVELIEKLSTDPGLDEREHERARRVLAAKQQRGPS